MDHAGGYTRYSNSQWYCAQLGLVLHIVVALADEIDEADFRALVRATLARAPHLIQIESLVADGYRATRADPDDLVRFERREAPAPDTAELRRELMRPFADTGAPTFRARCHVSAHPNRQGYRTVIALETSHVVTEGSDFAEVVRGRMAGQETRALPRVRLTAAQRLGVLALAPVAALGLTVAAKLSPVDPDDYVSTDLAFDRGSFRKAAAGLGIRQQSLLFALVLWVMRVPERKGKRLWIGYSARLRSRPAELADEAFRFWFKDLFVRARGAFPEFAGEIDARLADGQPDPLFAMTLANRAQGVNRRLFRLLPWLYRGRYFGFGVQDFTFSVAPPILPSGDMAVLRNATVYAGAGPSTGRGCLFVVSRDTITLTIRADRAVCGRTQALADFAQSLGIEIRARGPAPRAGAL